MNYLAVKNFRHHQHYHDDRPVAWIKFYGALLDDYEFQSLPEAVQAQLLKIWLLAARMKNRIPADPRFIQSKIGSPRAPNIALMMQHGWLVEIPENSREGLDQTLEENPESSSPRALAREEKRREEKRRGTRTRAAAPSDVGLGPIADAYEAIEGQGSFEAVRGQFVKYWHRLIDVHGALKCARVWTFSQSTGTERDREFRTPAKVAARFATFDPDAPAEPQDHAA